jgi:cytolysin-activating lysine-acyltransferase
MGDSLAYRFGVGWLRQLCAGGEYRVMFFHSRNGKESADPAAAPLRQDARQPPDKAAPPPAVAVAATTIDGTPPTATARAADELLPPEELKKRAEVSQRLAATMGRIVRLMSRSPRHRDHKLADVEWLALPAVRTGQCALIEAQSKAHGHVAPVAAVLWARVSAEVDKRLSDKLDGPIRLAPGEWRSGDILWLVDAIGDDRAIAGLVQDLWAREWKGKPVKARLADASGQVKVRLIGPQAAPSGAAAGA